MGYSDNQKTEYKQKTEGEYRKVTGLWRRKTTNKNGKEVCYFKSGKMNFAAFENMQAFGDKTEFLIMPVKRKRHPNSPDYFIYAVEGYAELKEDVYWDDKKP